VLILEQGTTVRDMRGNMSGNINLAGIINSDIGWATLGLYPRNMHIPAHS